MQAVLKAIGLILVFFKNVFKHLPVNRFNDYRPYAVTNIIFALWNNKFYNKTGIMKKFYPYKIKEGSAVKMSELLQHPELIDYRMDEQICRITDNCKPEDFIKKEWLDSFAGDQLYQVKTAYIDDRTFIILKSLLEPLAEIVAVEE